MKMNMNIEEIAEYLVYSLDDNGDWEYTREGIGVYNGRTFIVDLDDTGEENRTLYFCRKGIDVKAVLETGVKFGRYEKGPDGTYYYNINTDSGEEQEYNEAAFRAALGMI